jgi:hypothetical protein
MAEASIGGYNLGQVNSNTSTGNVSSGGTLPPAEPAEVAPFGGNNTIVASSLPRVVPSPVSDSINTTPRTAGIDKKSIRVSSRDMVRDFAIDRVVPEVTEVKPLGGFELQNKYVSEDYYSSTDTISGDDEFYEATEGSLKNKIEQSSDIEVQGRYSENREYFPKFSLSNITPRPDVNFKFIIKTVNDKEVKLFTSKLFYDYLVESYSRNIPYPSLANFPSVVTINLKPIIDNVKSFYNKEQKVGVRVESNVCVDITRDDDDNRTYTINYDKLLRYLDWTLSKPSANYEERLLPPQEISSYKLDGDFDDETTTNNLSEAEQDYLDTVFGSSTSSEPTTTTSEPTTNTNQPISTTVKPPSTNSGGVSGPPPPPPPTTPTTLGRPL